MSRKHNAWKKAKEFGIDTSLLEANLMKSYTQRIIDFQKAFMLMDALKKAGNKYYGRLQKTDRSTN